jgi:hypothetical protein
VEVGVGGGGGRGRLVARLPVDDGPGGEVARDEADVPRLGLHLPREAVPEGVGEHPVEGLTLGGDPDSGVVGPPAGVERQAPSVVRRAGHGGHGNADPLVPPLAVPRLVGAGGDVRDRHRRLHVSSPEGRLLDGVAPVGVVRRRDREDVAEQSLDLRCHRVPRTRRLSVRPSVDPPGRVERHQQAGWESSVLLALQRGGADDGGHRVGHARPC